MWNPVWNWQYQVMVLLQSVSRKRGDTVQCRGPALKVTDDDDGCCQLGLCNMKWWLCIGHWPSKCKAQFRRQTFHEPNLIHWIKYMKSLASESIGNACFNLEQLSRSFHLAWLGILPLEQLWNSFDSDAEPNAAIIIAYFVSSLTEMSIFVV